jgi:F-type H+-transporting ATPase subunit alpha
MTLSQMVSIIYVATKGHLDDVPMPKIQDFEKGFHKFVAEKYPDVVNDLEKGKELTDSVAQRLDKAAGEFKASFLKA